MGLTARGRSVDFRSRPFRGGPVQGQAAIRAGSPETANLAG